MVSAGQGVVMESGKSCVGEWEALWWGVASRIGLEAGILCLLAVGALPTV